MRQTDNNDLVEMFITAITTSFDPHTSYMSSRTFENFMIQMRLQLEGIGATLQASEDDGYTVIKRIVPGGAADKQGELKVEDKIVAVGQGDDEELNDVTGMKLDDVVEQIRGKAGTVVRLAILSEDSEIKTINIVREKIKLEDSAARGVVFDQGSGPDGKPYKIGVIDLPSFYADLENAGRRSSEYKSTTRDVDRILRDFRSQGVDAVVLDLRRNGGGSLREAIDCTGLFINYGPVVQVKDAYGQIQKYHDEKPGMSWDGPLVVLTSKFSASASEILAGAVQDYGRGIVVGDTTSHGKGTVQSLVNLNQLVFGMEDPPSFFGALKITMQQFYRPNGDSTQKRGVLADIVLPSISDKMDVGESDLDYPVEFDRIASAKFSRMALAQSELLDQLREASDKRVSESEEFRKNQEKIDAYVEQKNRKSVSLNREK
jgi:carboxyl-terminal processing protease